jgi:hypothetical protein
MERQVIDASREDTKMPSGENRDVANCDVSASFKCDHLIGSARGIRGWPTRLGYLPSGETAAADEARSVNHDVADAFPPYEAVVPVIVPEILVTLERRV